MCSRPHLFTACAHRFFQYFLSASSTTRADAVVFCPASLATRIATTAFRRALPRTVTTGIAANIAIIIAIARPIVVVNLHCYRQVVLLEHARKSAHWQIGDIIGRVPRSCPDACVQHFEPAAQIAIRQKKIKPLRAAVKLCLLPHWHSSAALKIDVRMELREHVRQQRIAIVRPAPVAAHLAT